MIRRLGVALALTAGIMSGSASASPSYELLDWDDLDGWESDDHGTALGVFLETCPDLADPTWVSICAVASHQRDNPKALFETFFKPVLITDGIPALFTGYYEPELQGSKVPTDRFQHPIYRRPPELSNGGQWYTREEIEADAHLKGRGLEIAWLADPVEAFFLQVQGSGRIRFTDGSRIRVGYGGTNGHDYRSIGTELARRGVFEPHQVSAPVIKRWVRDNPVEGKVLLHHNPSFIFFRELDDVPAERGPLGAMNRSVTAMRTIAVDPDIVPLGAPVWIEKSGRNPLRRLMVAQDTGSAIRGAQRADIFFGSGESAGRKAGRVRDPGRMVVLLPIPIAFALAPEG